MFIFLKTEIVIFLSFLTTSNGVHELQIVGCQYVRISFELFIPKSFYYSLLEDCDDIIYLDNTQYGAIVIFVILV